MPSSVKRDPDMNHPSRVLLTGATGYVGGRLLPLLVADGWRVRCLARQPELLSPRVPAGVEVVQGDLLDAPSLSAAMQGVDSAFYLVHSMGATGDFETQDRLAAAHFAAAAHAAGVRRIVYLGGLGEDAPDLSAHLRSRHEVGDRLRAHGVPVIELRASIIIGSGSLSFEMIRALVERLPVMVTPRWVRVTAQPIAIGDVLTYLRAALSLEMEGSVIVEIGGPDQVSYGELMREYARQRGLRRWTIPVPMLTPRLSSLWLGLVTPLYARVGRKLVDSLRHPHRGARRFRAAPVPHQAGRCRGGGGAGVAKRGFQLRANTVVGCAVRRHPCTPALGRDPLGQPPGGLPVCGCRDVPGPSLCRRRTHRRRGGLAPRKLALDVAWRAGPAPGRGGNAPWSPSSGAAARGRHPGLLARRVHPAGPAAAAEGGDEAAGPGLAGIRSAAGRDGGAAAPDGDVRSLGLWGLVYWYGVWPLHQVVFAGMLRGLARAAERHG
jgi:uncharacterized protein YbjT (DUF2867 family)